MNKFKLLFCGLMITFALSSCSPTLSPFTANVMYEGNWSDDALSKIQFYLSNDVVIQRDYVQGQSEIVSGAIKFVNGRQVEEVRIPRGTPGAFVLRGKNGNIGIGFDSKSTSRYLMFGPNPKRQGSYVLLASEWRGNRGKVTYDTKSYWTNGESDMALLLVDLSKYQHIKREVRTEQGRRVN